MKFSGSRSVITCALAMSALPVWAGPDDTLESVVVTGTYSPLAIDDLGASVTVLDDTRLARLNKRQLGDALRTVPGLQIEEQGGAGGLSVVSIRGGEANFTQILLDGVPLNDPTNSRGGSYDLGNISGARIARVEIVRGPQSAVYGSDAMAGVINLISYDPADPPAPELRVEGGERGYHDVSFTAGATLGDVGMAVDAGTRDSGELVPGSERRVDNAGLRLHWQLNEAHELSAQLRYLDGERRSYPEQSGGPLLALTDDLDRGDFRDRTAALSWDAQFSRRWHSRLTGSQFSHREEYMSPGVFPYAAVPPNGSDTDFERDQASWINTLKLADGYRLSIGADYRDENGHSEGYLDVGFPLPTDYRLSRETIGTFVDLHAELIPALVLQASARRDDPDDFDSETTLRLGARYQLLPTVQLAANWGEGFKLPSFFALGHALVGNPELQPETAEGWDLGATWQVKPQLSVSATAFFNRYRNLVDFDPEAFTNVNRREVETAGGEWQLQWQFAPSLALQAHATYTDIDVIDEPSTLLGRPAWKAGAWLDWQFLPRWHTGLDYEWTGDVPASSLHTGTTVVRELDAWHRVDWRLGWHAADALELELALDNLLDEDYQTAVGFPAPGRTLRLAATLHFGG